MRIDQERVAARRPSRPARVPAASLLPVAIAAALVPILGCGFDLDGGDAPRVGTPASGVRAPATVAAKPSPPAATRAPADNCYDESYGMYGNPTPEEQLILELINRARQAPDAEAVRLGVSWVIDDPVGPAVIGDIDINENESGATYNIQPLHPLAMNGRLLAAARAHCWDMNDRSFFDHYVSPPPWAPDAWDIASANYDAAAPMLSPGERIAAEGYDYATWGENIAMGQSSPEAHHAAYIVDDYPNTDGRGHRLNCLDNANFAEVGIGYIHPGIGAANRYSTEDFGRRNAGAYPEFQAFITGVVFDDTDGDGFYDIGEGVADVTVMPDSGDWHAITSDAGGYAIPLTTSGAVTVTFQFPAGYGTAVAGKPIDVDDPLARKLDCTFQETDAFGYIEFSSVTFSHDESGGSAIITVSRTGGDFGDVGVTCETVTGGTATAGGDYTTATDTLLWTHGDSADKTFTVPISLDNNDEPDETVALLLTNATGGAALGTDTTATLTIIDDDDAGVIRITTAPPTVGEEGVSVAISVERDPADRSDGEVSVSYATSDGSATAGPDYTATSDTFTWLHGVTGTQTINVPIVNLDTILEPNETFSVTLSGETNGATIGTPGAVVVTIVDDDNPGAISFASASESVDENVGAAEVVLQVTRTGGQRGIVSVDWSTSPGSAVAPDDFITAGGTLQWLDKAVDPQDITIPIVNDGDLEIDEEFTVTLSNVTVASLGAPGTATVTIGDNESDSSPPVLTLAQPLAGETLSGIATVAGTATDILAVVSVEIRVDGGAFVSVPGVPLADSVSWSFPLPTWGLANGDHDITVHVTDYHGVSAETTVTVTVWNEIGILGANGVGGCLPGAGAGGGAAAFAMALLSAAALLRRRR